MKTFNQYITEVTPGAMRVRPKGRPPVQGQNRSKPKPSAAPGRSDLGPSPSNGNGNGSPELEQKPRGAFINKEVQKTKKVKLGKEKERIIIDPTMDSGGAAFDGAPRSSIRGDKN
jgi:hypothetical protein